MNPFRIMRLDEVVSTNDEVKRAIDQGEPEGFVCRARVQTGGYGRQGRAWSSPAGGSYQSVLLRPEVPAVQLPTLALVVALAVRRAALRVGGLSDGLIQVKWPNDVVVAGSGAPSKLAGISCEAHAGGVCVGIGVNVLHPETADGAVPAGKYAPAYLQDLIADPSDGETSVERTGDAVLDALAAYCNRWIDGGFAALAGEFSAYSYLAGRSVRIADLFGAVTAEGIAEGVDEQGRLLVRTAAGIVPIASGEAHLLP